MLTVACVFRTFTNVVFGGAYDDSWVRKLRDSVARHLTVPHRFVCLTNQDMILGVETKPLVHNWDGWWSKLEMFRPGVFAGPVLSFDLDVVVTGNIDHMAGPHPTMMMLRDVYPHIKNSTCMWWDASDPHYARIYETFRADPVGRAKFHHIFNTKSMGDQGLITDTMAESGREVTLWQDKFGDDAYRHFSAFSAPNYTFLNAPFDPKVNLVYCLGKPKFNDFPQHPFVQQHWRESAQTGLDLGLGL